MTVKQNFQSVKKGGDITRSERTSINQQVESILKDIKKKTGDVILIPITKRTSIELPASFTKEQIEARVANYLKVHNSKV